MITKNILLLGLLAGTASVMVGCTGDTEMEEKSSSSPTTAPTQTLTQEQEEVLEEYQSEENDPLVQLLTPAEDEDGEGKKEEEYRLSQEDFLAKWKQEEGVLIDLRTPEEIAEVAGLDESAQNFDTSSPDFAENFRNLDMTQSYFLYSTKGNRSLAIYEAMKTAGFESVYVLEGGIEAE